MGIGKPVGTNIIAMQLPFAVTVILANLPQIVLSYLYLLFNGLFTCMVAGMCSKGLGLLFLYLTTRKGNEWMQYAHRRSTLRVTSPKGAQRSTYWLQLPCTYSIPLLILSSLLSWLASQSIFVVQIDVLVPEYLADDYEDRAGSSTISSCGYSAGAIVLTLVVGSIIAVSALLVAARRYPPGIPLASTCSAAISAACHPPPDDVDAAVLPVQWGVVSTKDGIGHCSLSSKLVAPPIPGRSYV